MKPVARLTSYLTQKLDQDPRGNLLRQVAQRGDPRRMTAAWALRVVCPGLGYPSIAHRLGYSDHSGALKAYTKAEQARADFVGYRALTDELVRDARAIHAEAIAQINNETKARPAAEELESIMTDVRRATARLDKTVDRLAAYLEAVQ